MSTSSLPSQNQSLTSTPTIPSLNTSVDLSSNLPTLDLGSPEQVEDNRRSTPSATQPLGMNLEPAERTTSPRRDNSDIERIGHEKAQGLQKEAQHLQESLAVILDRIAKIKEEYERLSSENKFLQDYIGNLMSTGNLISK